MKKIYYSEPIIVFVLFIVLVSVIISVSTAVHAQYSSTIVVQMNPSEDFFNSGSTKFEENDYEGAFKDFSEAIRLNPGYAAAYFARGRARYELQQREDKVKERDYESTIADFSEAIRLNPGYAAAYFARGRARYELQDTSGAIADYSQVIQIDPNYTEAYHLRGLAYSALNSKREAILDYIQVIRLIPNNPIKQRDKQRVFKNYAHLMQTNLDLAHVYYRGLVHFYLWELEEWEKRMENQEDSEVLEDLILEMAQWEKFNGNLEIPAPILEDLNQVIQLNPNFSDAYYYRGIVSNSTQEAITHFTKAIQLDPSFSNAYYQGARTRTYQKDRQGAVQDYTRAIQIDPSFTDAYYQRGLLFSQLLDPQGAVKDYIQTLKINPLAYVSDQEVANDYLQALQMNPQDSDTYYKRGLARHALQDYTGAIQDFTEAIRLNPKLAESYFARAQVRPQILPFASSDKKGIEIYTQVMEDYSKAIQLNPIFASAYLARGQFRIQYPGDAFGIFWSSTTGQPKTEEILKTLKASIQDYTQAIQLNPNLAEAYISRASANLIMLANNHSENKNTFPPEVVEDVKQAIRLAWNHKIDYFKQRLPISYLTIDIGNRSEIFREIEIEKIGPQNNGINQFQLKAEQRAIARYGKLIDQNPSDANAHYRLGLIYLKRGDFQQAIADFTRVIEINPQDSDAFYNRGLAYYSLKNYQEAIKDYTKAIQLAPNLAESYYYSSRAFAYYESKNIQQAIADAKQALQLDPQDGSAYIVAGLSQYALGEKEEADETYGIVFGSIWQLPLPPFGGSALASQPQKASIYYERGRKLARQGDRKGAINSLRQAGDLFYSQGNMTRYQEIQNFIRQLQ